jgi:hypothetical protein
MPLGHYSLPRHKPQASGASCSFPVTFRYDCRLSGHQDTLIIERYGLRVAQPFEISQVVT